MCIVSIDRPRVIPIAKCLPGPSRLKLALDALSGLGISRIAAENHVSRKFVYQQLHRANAALDAAFHPAVADTDILYYLPITKSWLRQFVLGLVLTCHSSFRGVCALLQDHFDYSLSVGSVFNIVHQVVSLARSINSSEDLSAIKIGAHDEIFQAGQPVLVGIDVHSTYCYLLSQQEHRDADTWAVNLLELVDQGFKPDATIADFAGGIRAGQEITLPGVPCRGDVFHALHEFSPLVRHLESRAYLAMETVEKLSRQASQYERRHGRKNLSLVQRLRLARQGMDKAIRLADEVATLYTWLQQDILSVAGPNQQSRQELLNFVVEELSQREQTCEQRIRAVRVMLANQGAKLLSFAGQLDKDLAELATGWQVSEETVRELLRQQQMSDRDNRKWQQDAKLRGQLGSRYYGLSEAVKELSEQVVRASSMVENVNSRLRSYFFLRRQLGGDYLELLRFYLNHKRYARSEHPGRVGKSPAEMLSGQEQPHWLELLGYQRFQQAA